MVKILDTTLRDGGYAIDFRFSLRDIGLIARELDAAGIPLIEVGHGLGLRAGEASAHLSPLKDADVMVATREVVKSGKWGFFCIPGIARLEDVDTAAANGCNFIRIGVDITDVAPAFPFIGRVKRGGMLACVNLMKSYALAPAEVPAVATALARAGADAIAIVDSAGTMTPDDVAEYLGAVAQATDLPRGFHGHNNLDLATANCLRATEIGAEIVDGSLRGLARSAGNAATETLALLFGRLGQARDVDPYRLMDVAERMIDPLLRMPGSGRSIQQVSGIAGFHSSYEPLLRREAERAGVDVRRLIPKASELSRTELDAKQVRAAAQALAKDLEDRASAIGEPVSFHAYLRTDGGIETQLRSVLASGRSMAKKLGKTFVLNLVQCWRCGGRSFISAVLQEAPEAVIASAELRGATEAREAAAIAAAEDCDLIFLDTDQKTPESGELVAAVRAAFPGQILPYGDLDVQARATEDYLHHLRPQLKSLALVGDGPLRTCCERRLAVPPPGLMVESALAGKTRKIEALVCCNLCPDEVVDWIEEGGLLLDAYIGALSASAYERAKSRGVQAVRVDMHAALHAELFRLRRMNLRFAQEFGEGRIGDFPVAARGALASCGAVIVDSITHPGRVLGVADGRGFLKSSSELTPADFDAIHAVEAAIGDAGPATVSR